METDALIKDLWRTEERDWVIEVRIDPQITDLWRAKESMGFWVTLTHPYYHERHGWGDTVAGALSEAIEQLKSPTVILVKKLETGS